MTPTAKAIENAARAIGEELARDINAWVERWTFPGGIYHDAPSPPTGRYRATPERTAKAALSADLGDMVLVPMEPNERILARSSHVRVSVNIEYGSMYCDVESLQDIYRAMIAAAEETSCK